MTGLFADINVNPDGANGAFYGHPVQLWYQIAGILTAIGIYLNIILKKLTYIYFFLNKGFAGACTALILLPLKYTIGIRLSAEEELRGLDWIGKIYFFFKVILILLYYLAHGEKWELNDKPKKKVTTTSSNLKPPSYSNLSTFTQNLNPFRSRSKLNRRNQVRLRSDISQNRSAYTRSQSQIEKKNPQVNGTLPV